MVLTQPRISYCLIEVLPNIKQLQQIHTILRDSGSLLISEPIFHVSNFQFEREIDIARNVGFRVKDEPNIAFGHSVVLVKKQNMTQLMQ